MYTMKNKDNQKEKAAELRSQAEAKLSERKKNDASSPATEADARRLVRASLRRHRRGGIGAGTWPRGGL